MKPSVTLEFDLGDVVLMKPPVGAAGAVPPKESLLIRGRTGGVPCSIFIVSDSRVIPIAIADDTQVELVVSR